MFTVRKYDRVPRSRKLLDQGIRILILLGFPSLFAQSLDKDSVALHLYDLSLKELSQIQVDVASQRPENLHVAPGSITAYGARTMDELGYYTLRDLANITPGYSSFRGIGEITFETRGRKSDGFDNNKHLVLIDGIPFSHTRANKANAEEELPLLGARQVEFLRGPGSALYGMSAFHGVINISMSTPEYIGTQGRVKLSVGSYDFKRRAMVYISHRTEKSISKISVGYFAKKADRQFLGNGQIQNFNARNFDNRNTLSGFFSHEITAGVLSGLTFGTMVTEKKGGLGDFWMDQQNQTYEFNELIWEQFVLYLKYKKKMGRHLEYNAYTKYNLSTEKAFVGGYQVLFSNDTTSNVSFYNVRVDDVEASHRFTYAMDRVGELSAGFVFVTRFDPGHPESYSYAINSGPGITFVPNEVFYRRSSRYNVYSFLYQYQNTFSVLRGLSVTAGGRLDIGRVNLPITLKRSNAFSEFSPRISMVQKFHPNLSAKLLYGEAMRPPLLKEVGINEEFKNENPEMEEEVKDVTAEETRSLELVVQWQSQQLIASGSTFWNVTQNTISKITPDGTTNQINANIPGNAHGWGWEAEMQYAPSFRWRFSSNFSYARVQLPQKKGDNYNVPVSKWNNIFICSFSKKRLMTMALVSKWITAYRLGGETPWGDYGNATVPGHMVLDANFRIEPLKDYVLEFQLLNALNSEYRTPAFFASGELNVPGAGRSFLISLDAQF